MKPELLAPAGTFEKLKYAVEYGADAVYMGCPGLSLRTGAEKYSFDELNEGKKYAHDREVKFYIALNIFAYNDDIVRAESAVGKLKDIGVDAIIVSDPGILHLIRQIWPESKVHLSTQANTTNHMSLAFWEQQGISRSCLARELTLDSIRAICEKSSIEVEAFVHGSMCLSYSGRCYLSKYMAQRDANQGDCSHSCRWSYDLIERKRPDQRYEICEDRRGTYLMNSKDLCLAAKIPDLIQAGVSAFKIEGRIKTVHYISVVTSVYKKIIDSYMSDPEGFEFDPDWMDDLTSVSHRQYTEGFLGADKADLQYTDFRTSNGADFVGVITSELPSSNGVYEYEAIIKNQIKQGDTVEFFQPGGFKSTETMNGFLELTNQKELDVVNPNQRVIITSKHKLAPMTLVRVRPGVRTHG